MQTHHLILNCESAKPLVPPLDKDVPGVGAVYTLWVRCPVIIMAGDSADPSVFSIY